MARLLGDSPRARDLQRLGQSELKRLLTGSPVEQDLLGLLTAARGGLSGPDLRELTASRARRRGLAGPAEPEGDRCVAVPAVPPDAPGAVRGVTGPAR